MENQNEESFEQVFGISEEELEEIKQKAREAYKSHTWRQKGVWLVCRSCPLEHSINIGNKKIMVGEEKDGTPILVDRDKPK